MVSDLKNTTLLEVDQGWYHEFLQQLTTTRWLTSHFSLQHQCITRIAIINRTTLSWSNTRNKKNTRERKLEYRNLSKSVRKIRVDLLLDPFPFSSFDSQKRWHYISRIKWFIVFFEQSWNCVTIRFWTCTSLLQVQCWVLLPPLRFHAIKLSSFWRIHKEMQDLAMPK